MRNLKIITSLLLIIPVLYYAQTDTQLIARGERGGGGFDRGGSHENFNHGGDYHHENFNREGNYEHHGQNANSFERGFENGAGFGEAQQGAQQQNPVFVQPDDSDQLYDSYIQQNQE